MNSTRNLNKNRIKSSEWGVEVKSHELNSQTNYALLKLQKPVGSFAKSNISTRAPNVIVFNFIKKILVDTYPCFGLLMTSPLGFKARVGSLVFNWSSTVFEKKISYGNEL